ncbi:GAF domain-containing protein [bacterium]|nr:GAF domain-containing protein [bacterium]
MPQPLGRLSTVINEIHTSLSTRHILDSTLKWIAELLLAETGVILLPQPHSSVLKAYIRKHQGKNSQLVTLKLSKAQGLEAWVLSSGKGAIANTSQGKDSIFQNTDLPFASSIRNCMAVPLKNKSKTIGVLEVINRHDYKSFTTKQLHFLEMLALHTATALTNAHTYATQHTFLNEQKKHLLATTEQLRGANIKLREADQTKSESISMVAHELRSPITSISGFAKILWHNKIGPLNKEQSEFCEIILKNSDHIQCLISDLMDLTKLELGRLEMHFKPVSCRELIKEAVLSVQGSAAKDKQRIHTEFINEELFVTGDRLRLVQVLINLLSNALKYSPVQSPVYLRYRADNKYIAFMVEDRGTTLTPEQQKKVFEKFYRIKKTKPTKQSKTPGSGLGLAICQIIINNHDGTIWAEAAPEHGNIFGFRVKRTLKPSAPPL